MATARAAIILLRATSACIRLHAAAASRSRFSTKLVSRASIAMLCLRADAGTGQSRAGRRVLHDGWRGVAFDSSTSCLIVAAISGGLRASSSSLNESRSLAAFGVQFRTGAEG